MADDQIKVGALWAEGIIARCSDFRAGLPPAVLPANYLGVERLVETGPSPNLPASALVGHAAFHLLTDAGA